MNNYGAFTRLLFGLNKTLRIAGQVIPIYRDSKPLVKNVYNFVKKKNNCFKEGELDKDSVVKDFLTTASDRKNYKTKYYNLDVIISVGCRVKSKRGAEFRKWAEENR